MTELPRARGMGIAPGVFEPGAGNGITDVVGVRVGHQTVRREPDIHSGVTAIVAADANPHAPIPAGLFCGNGYGKLIGATQIVELGVIESPVILTSTLSAFRAADALVSWMLNRRDCADVRSFNPVVAECNDGFLSDIRSRPVTEEHVLRAIADAARGPVAEGSVGAGTGMTALGLKAGIGTSSRVLDVGGDAVTVGALVLANFGGRLRVGGVELSPPGQPAEYGSCVVVIATDAPLDARQLGRVARRAVFGLGRVGASYSHGSGDYGIALSTGDNRGPLADGALSPIFEATLDCVEESVLNSLCAAGTTIGVSGHVAPGLALGALREALG